LAEDCPYSLFIVNRVLQMKPGKIGGAGSI
jgi:hypothetical protein